MAGVLGRWCRLLPSRKLCILGTRIQLRAINSCMSRSYQTFSTKYGRHHACLGLRSKDQTVLSSMKLRCFSNQPPHKHHDSSTVHHSVASVVQRLHEVEERMRVKGYSLLRWGLVAVVVMGITLYFFREEVRENVADEVAEVASRSLGDENVVNKANEMTKLVLQDIINDPETSRLASNFVRSVLNLEDVRNSAVDLTLFVLRDPKTNEKVSELAAATVRDLMSKEETRKLMLGYIKTLILDSSTQSACIEMIKGLLEDPQLKAFMAESLGSLVASAVVTNKAIELGKNVTHQIVIDEEIQKETGDVLWSMIKDTVTPWWLGGKKDS